MCRQPMASCVFCWPGAEAAKAARDMHARAQVWARAQALEGEPDGFNSALLSLLAAHLTASGTLVPILLFHPSACHVPLSEHLQAQGAHPLVYLS